MRRRRARAAEHSTLTNRVRFEANAPWPAAFVEHEGAWLTLHSRRDPIAEANRLLSEVTDDTPMVVLVGVGLGYALDALEERGWRGRVLAIEVEPALERSMSERRDWSSWGGRLTRLGADSLDGSLWRAFEGLASEAPTIVHPVLARTHADAVKRVQARLAHAWFEHTANDQARRANAGRYLLNTLRNLPALRTEGDAAALDGLFDGVPAIVVAAGPSLDRNLAELEACADRALIVAVDTAARPLLAAGIPPHVIVAVDPTETNARHLCDLGPCPDTWLAAEASLDATALPDFAGRTFFFRIADHHPWPWLRAQGLDRGMLRAWGSVLTSAFDLALRMGCNPVVFAGADLAFTWQRPYARGVTFEEEWRRSEALGRSLKSIWAEALATWDRVEETDVRGERTATAPHLRAFRDWIAEQTRTCGAQVFNATGQGILHGGAIRQADLAALARSWPERALCASTRLRTAHRARASDAEAASPVPPFDEWTRFAADVTETDCRAALGDVAVSASRSTTRQEAWLDEIDADVRRIVETLGPSDRARLDERLADARDGRWAFIASTSPDADLLANLRTLADRLPPDGTIFVIEGLGTTPGIKLRHAVEALITERPHASLEYWQVDDPGSRLVVVTLDGVLRHTPVDPDFEEYKQSDRCRDTADRILPLVLSYFQPRSVIELGCGAGHWIDAARRLGVPKALGVTARDIAGWSVPDERFDLCLCIEVAHLLPPDEQDALIAAAARASDVVVFSSLLPAHAAYPGSRPLAWWVEKFWRHGYVFEDGLRAAIAERYPAPLDRVDSLTVFRRVLTPGASDPRDTSSQTALTALQTLARVRDDNLYDRWQQGRRSSAPTGSETPWHIPPHRLIRGDNGTVVFRFRTQAARWWLTHPDARVHVLEGERLLPRCSSVAAAERASHGGYVLSGDEIILLSGDRARVRAADAGYSLLLPPHVADAEARPLSEIFRLNL